MHQPRPCHELRRAAAPQTVIKPLATNFRFGMLNATVSDGRLHRDDPGSESDSQADLPNQAQNYRHVNRLLREQADALVLPYREDVPPDAAAL
jgi:hypothetical protein